MSSDFYSGDDVVERGSIPLDIDNVHMLLQGQSLAGIFCAFSWVSVSGYDSNRGALIE